jgi:INO80 complex subunit C
MQAPYTDPITGLRFHDKSIYELIKGLVSECLDFCY